MAAGNAKFGQLGIATERRQVESFQDVIIDAPITQIYAGNRYSAAVSCTSEKFRNFYELDSLTRFSCTISIWRAL
jgi:hypothetical protein